MKAFSRNKRKTKAFHFPRGSFSAYISKTLSRSVEIDITPARPEAAGGIGYFDFRSVPFSMNKHAKNGTCNVFYVPFSTFSRMENRTDWNSK